MNFAVSAGHTVKTKENEKRNKYLDLTRELKKTMEYGSNGDTTCNWCTRNGPQKIREAGWKSWTSENESRP